MFKKCHAQPFFEVNLILGDNTKIIRCETFSVEDKPPKIFLIEFEKTDLSLEITFSKFEKDNPFNDFSVPQIFKINIKSNHLNLRENHRKFHRNRTELVKVSA